jgi:hypothetical protein
VRPALGKKNEVEAPNDSDLITLFHTYGWLKFDSIS